MYSMIGTKEKNPGAPEEKNTDIGGFSDVNLALTKANKYQNVSRLLT